MTPPPLSLRLRPLLIMILALVWGLAWPLWRRSEANLPLLAAGLALAACDAAWPAATAPLWRLLLKVRNRISATTTLLMTALMYLIVIVPAGMIGRLAGGFRRAPPADSYYQPAEPRPPGHMKRTF